ncbi:uncharacterized protein CTHT_0005200 [Thermochaetoides thermophila DSM 1495]|uniref:Pentatricopeptide repeat domain-containing protein n=1 Tax=Chaetomium thermophilum (strain DSM 1495 / CBS 144.50 / IMI 039719) TaxID=759272 RepID=G0RY30_CHATD|nr:hypothetical protein CTHT_0005200 [Thermochaetoides thermophila DSM 1495]EGS23816.1 hypothetical protein CTHT_0005200 [Thermochaetoides thermophila DSM 1495]
MATAAVLDAKYKDKRREKLDRELNEAKNKLASLLEESNAHDLAQLINNPYPDPIWERSLEEQDVIKSICVFQPEYLERVEQIRKDRRTTLKQLRDSLGMPWSSSIPEGTSTLAKAQEILCAEEANPAVEHREPKTELQLHRMTNMVTDLVDRLIEEAWWQTEQDLPGKHPSLTSPDSARTMIRLLRSEGYPAYAHPSVDEEETVIARSKLNEVNLQIIANWIPFRREKLVGQICYNLTVCSVVPAIQNYNALIMGFSLLGEHRLAQAVVDSFLYKSHLRPTEGTYLCLLHHYRLKKDIVGFWGVLRRLFGHDPRGIGLRRRTADDVLSNNYLKMWARSSPIRISNGYVVERVPLSQNLTEAIIEGLIDFRMLREAAKLLAVSLHNGWVIGTELLERLFHACISSLDYSAVKVIVQGLLNNLNQATEMILGPHPISQAAVRQLRHILNIFQAHYPTLSEKEPHPFLSMGEFNWALYLPPKPPISKSDFSHLVKAIWIRQALHNSRIMIARIRRANQLLSDHSKPLLTRLDLVFSILDNAIGRPERKLKKNEFIHRLAHIDWIETQLAYSAKQITMAEYVLCNVLAKQVPRLLRAPEHFDPEVPITQRVSQATSYTIPGTAEYYAASCWWRSKEIDWQLKQVLLDALPRQERNQVMRRKAITGQVHLNSVMSRVKRYLLSFSPFDYGDGGKRKRRTGPLAKLWEKLPVSERLSRLLKSKTTQPVTDSAAASATTSTTSQTW